MTYTDTERAYLATRSLGRLATVNPAGVPQVRPVGFVLNTDGTVDIGGPALSASLKWRNAETNPHVAFVVDDMTPDEPGAYRPGWGRGVEIRGRAELLTDHEPPFAPEFFSNEVLRIHPERVIGWNLEGHGNIARDVR
ncbi:PPOX class F420-dependent oxidoreductase [Streptomyces sp. SID3343]|uniref:PPOX class F420-dependent oxidoreductase n=1 Tax=Streptomyces sp. SID3343 TaxID=2690260 RepID=UPI00136E95CB|nr:PPOX class F420-dependent oxidoreductase [Streptomyces sp. SID3343]MYV96728.1 PPOX class F420-dependent oxidoreductase [Streptomyces sp. SID3343]MYW04817.1 PPOX class F420-dependent oxidoreductase [Streptomyces sp. SID3343]